MSLPVSTLVVLVNALAFAANAHKSQRRKNKQDPGTPRCPYINHPIDVLQVLTKAGHVDSVLLTAAVLHDIAEDVPERVAEMIETFGQDVYAVVMEVTDDKTLPWQERKALQIKTAGQLSWRAQCIRVADKLSNRKDVALADWPETRKHEYIGWSQLVLDAITDTRARALIK